MRISIKRDCRGGQGKPRPGPLYGFSFIDPVEIESVCDLVETEDGLEYVVREEETFPCPRCRHPVPLPVGRLTHCPWCGEWLPKADGTEVGEGEKLAYWEEDARHDDGTLLKDMLDADCFLSAGDFLAEIDGLGDNVGDRYGIARRVNEFLAVTGWDENTLMLHMTGDEALVAYPEIGRRVRDAIAAFLGKNLGLYAYTVFEKNM